MRKAIAIALAIGANSAQATELGFPASALVEAGEPKLFAASAAPGLGVALDPAQSEDSASADEKTLKYTGKCYAKVDGSIRIKGRCPVVWKTGEEVSVSLSAYEGKVEPEKIAWAGVSREGRKWYAYWRDVTQESGSARSPDTKDLGEVRKHGSCWTNRRVRICEHES
jgi:hypothetical protein